MFLGDFVDANDVFSSFHVPYGEQEAIRILYAEYDCDGYNGSAFVFFLRGSKLYTVSGSHCSCYGLEDQWDPEEITFEEIRHYRANSSAGHWSREIWKYVDRLEHLDLEVLRDEEILMYLRLAMG